VQCSSCGPLRAWQSTSANPLRGLRSGVPRESESASISKSRREGRAIANHRGNLPPLQVRGAM